MAVSHLFRDMIFVKAGRLQIYGLCKEIHINAKICNLSLWDPKEIRNRHIYNVFVCVFVYVYACGYEYTYVYAYVYVHAYVYTHMCMHAYMYMIMHVHTHVYVYEYMFI